MFLFYSVQDQEERDATKAKVDKKMEKRAFKKELKKDLGVDKCKQQWPCENEFSNKVSYWFKIS